LRQFRDFGEGLFIEPYAHGPSFKPDHLAFRRAEATV